MTARSIILVHGAWHGGWCWDRVAPLLREAGFEVLTPTLSGLEADATSTTPPSLEDHVRDVAAAVEQASGDVLLVGHSYGGMPITGAAARVRAKLAGLVYLDAAVPSDGQSFASHIPGIDDATVQRRVAAFTAMAGGGDWLPVPPFEMIGISAEADKAWLAPRLRPHPLRTWLEPVDLSGADLDGLSRTYVLATDPPTTLMGYPAHGARAAVLAGWSSAKIASGHELMVLAPRETADAILRAARA